MRLPIRIIILIAGIVELSAVRAQPGHVRARLVQEELVFHNDSFPSCHASTLAELADHSLAIACFGGSGEGKKDVCIWLTQQRQGRWTAPRNIANGLVDDTTRFATWNPVLFTANSRLYLFYKTGASPRDWWGMMQWSQDGGASWSTAERLPGGMLGPIKNKPVRLKNGMILYPSSTESADEKKWQVHVEQTDGSIVHWRKYPIYCDSFGVIQPALLQYPGNKLQLLCRSRQNAIVETWSSNNGRTWGPLRKLPVLNPNSGIDAVTLVNGWQLLVYNPAVAGANWFNGRNELRVAASRDGRRWKDVYVLEQHAKGEYSYPAIIQTSDGLVHITYTYNRGNIKHVALRIKN